MSAKDRGYRAPPWLPGGHAQTIYASLLPRPEVRYRRERFETPDGDFVDFDWLETGATHAPLVVLFHGLEGDSSSHYSRALMLKVKTMGWQGVVPHFRGCSGEPNRLPRAYHSGDYSEVEWMLSTIHARMPHATIFAAGVSLGGSALLNWIGRESTQAAAILTAAAAVSTPLDLSAAGFAIGQGLNRIYSRHFLGTLVPKAMAMARRFPGTLDELMIRRVGSMYAFDEPAASHGSRTSVCRRWCLTQRTILSSRRTLCRGRGKSGPACCWNSPRTEATAAFPPPLSPAAWIGCLRGWYHSFHPSKESSASCKPSH